jgi:serine/threonine protein kinase
VTSNTGASSLPPEARVGHILNGKWLLDRLIEVGGMSAVYAARHRNGRRAAIKMLKTEFSRDSEVRKRFLREGYVANKIDHPGAVDILDDDVSEDGVPFLVMELLEGESLAAWLARAGGRIPAPEMLAIALQLLEVLQVAHDNGIIHRDIKPGNVFLTKAGHAKLLDFGLARIRDGVISLVPTASGIVLGTAGYMSPEQARGMPEEIDARTDLFAVGALIFRAVTGRPIHEKATPFDTVIASMKERVAPFATVVPGSTPILAAAMDGALAFEKGSRWQSARDMAQAIRGAYDEARRRPPPLPARRPAPEGTDATFLDAIDAPSLVVEVAFGEKHDEEIERERRRTREATKGITR